jgi:hypothetical protein
MTPEDRCVRRNAAEAVAALEHDDHAQAIRSSTPDARRLPETIWASAAHRRDPGSFHGTTLGQAQGNVEGNVTSCFY